MVSCFWQAHKGLTQMLRKYSFVGMVDVHLSLLQFNTKLILVNHTALRCVDSPCAAAAAADAAAPPSFWLPVAGVMLIVSSQPMLADGAGGCR